MTHTRPGNIIIGTAGHVDHGKTALVHRLTGIDTDRFQEEKERGLTIDLGFAYIDLGGDELTRFVDVPGPDRLLTEVTDINDDGLIVGKAQDSMGMIYSVVLKPV